MTSGVFHAIPTASITIDRDNRQRRELTGVEELAESISRIGLINPIVITRANELVAGERRLTAIRLLGWDKISVQYVDELDYAGLRSIELEENIKRVDLTWQDQVRALAEYHELRTEQAEANGEAWTQTATADAIGLDKANVSRQLMVARELSNPKVAEAPKLSVARGIVERNNARKDDQAILSLRQDIAMPADRPLAVEPESIITASFNEWAPTYHGPKFNLIHCDFPYGIGAGDFDQGSAAAHGGYDDSPDTYWTLCRTLADNLDRLASPSCHLLFWFSMKFYRETLDFFHTKTDFLVEPFPLIWMKSDNVGILPDPTRGPRRIYETAFLARRGDRPVVQAVANAYHGPTVRDRHMSEKPEPVLRHFFRMLVDTNSIVLDPTCGSGSAIRAAESAGARHVLGIELNPEYAERAKLALKQSRSQRKAS